MTEITTNLFAIPLIQIIVETGTNEDWVDSLKFLVDDGSGNVDTMPQLDLRGITFEMEVRRSAVDHEVILSATIEDGKLSIGDPPDFGYLLIDVSNKEMSTQYPGSYIADIIGYDAQYQRRIATIDLTIVEGITR